MNKFFIKIILSFAFFCITVYAADDWADGTTPVPNYAYMSAATVENAGIKGDYIFATISQSGHSKIFYTEKTEKETYATLLTAISSGRSVKVYFSYDSYSPDINWSGIIATHRIGAIELK